MKIAPAYREIVDFIAAGTPPQNVVDFSPSEEAKERVAELIYRERTTGLTSEETAELNRCLQIEHLMRLAKSRAQYYLKNEKEEKKMKTEQKQTTPLSPEQMEQWENDGYLLLKDVVPESYINGVRDRFAHVVDGIIDQLKEQKIVEDEGADLPFETRFWEVAGEHANRFGRSWRGQIATSEIFDLHYAGPLVDAIGQLTGTDVIGHPVFNARPKLPGQQLTVVPWHQDSGYFGKVSEESLIPTTWIPLVPVDETNGCLQVVAGSHRLGVVDHHTESREGRFLEVMDELIEDSRIVTCPMEIGDALVFHNLTLHRSLPHTTSEIIRWAIDIRYLRDGDHPGSIYWKDPDFKWVIRSETQPLTTLAQWLEMW